MTGRLVLSGRTRSGTAREHLAWLGAGLVMGFAVPFVFADVLQLPRDVYYGVHIAAVLAFFEKSTAAARKQLDRSDAELMAFWTLKRDGHEVFTMPRTAAFRSFVLNHLIHHRGQLSVYLRLNDIPVPPIYGPSADEG